MSRGLPEPIETLVAIRDAAAAALLLGGDSMRRHVTLQAIHDAAEDTVLAHRTGLEGALARLSKAMGTPLPGPAAVECPERVQGRSDGAMRCPRCGMAWDRDEARPPCPLAAS